MSTYLVARPSPRRPMAPAQRRSLGFAPVTPPTAPAVDLSRQGEDGVITVEAPGLDPAADLSVTVTGDRLALAGVRRTTTGGMRREMRFSRTVALPEGMTADAVSADYSAGVLSVRVAGMFPTPVAPETHTVAITSDVKVVDAPAQDQAAPEVLVETGTDEQQSGAPAQA